MTAPALDGFLLRHAPQVPLPVDAALLRARRSLNGALATLDDVSDAALEGGWPWRGGEADVRYGFYRQFEALQEARAAIRPKLTDAWPGEPPARPLVASATSARWALHGLLAGLTDEELDLDPGNSEWTLRQTLAHIVGTQRGYGWFSCWWLAQRDLQGEAFPSRVPEELAELMPEDETEGAGTREDIRRRLDDILDLSGGALAGLDDEALAQRARWSGMPVSIGFRIGRWSSHIREHTVQLEKTLDMLGRRPSEVQRLLRLLGEAYGRLEEDLFMWPADARPTEALAITVKASDRLAEDADTIRKAASRPR